MSFRAPGFITALAIVVVLAGVGSAIALQRAGRPGSGSAPGAGPGAGPGGGGRLGTTSTTSAVPTAPLAVTSVTPAPGAVNAAYDSAVTIHFSEPLSAHSPLPVVTPATRGRWVRLDAATIRFVPAGNFPPFAAVQVSVPGGATGMTSRYGQHLPGTIANHFTIAGASELRLQQLLAELDYLPVQFVPASVPSGTSGGTTTALHTSHRATGLAASAAPATTNTAPATPTTRTTTKPAPTTVPPTTVPPLPAVASEPSVTSAIPLDPRPGTFTWRFPNVPLSLSWLWRPGQANVVTTGAVMAFQSDHGLATDGSAGPAVWAALLAAVAHRQTTAAPYDYVSVTTSLPEQVDVWRNGSVVFQTLANTGIPQAPTALGTWPVYARYAVTTMSGTNPDGTKYSDPGIPSVSYFNGGDALHGYVRPGYGYPQSLGCVEMPYAAAATVFPMTPLGTLVTVL